MHPRPEHVVVVGAGPVGLALACELRSRGPDVTVIERHTVGSGASAANAGQISPDIASPFASPTTRRELMTGIVSRDPSIVAPTVLLDRSSLRFVAAFLRAARPHQSAANVAALRRLVSRTRPALEALISRGLEIPLSSEPYLAIYASSAEASRALQHIRAVWTHRTAPPPNRVASYEELSQLEPCLSPGARAGLVVDGQLAVDPSLLVSGLAKLARRDGVHIMEQTWATSLAVQTAGINIHTSRGTVSGDCVVVASGTWSPPLLRTLGVHLPIIPGIGYSFSVDFDVPPRHVIMLRSAHVAVLPLGTTTRVSGEMLIGTTPEKFEAARIAKVVTAGAHYLRGVAWASRRCEWCGPRPMTPSGLPFIGRVRGFARVFVAAGHSAWGLTLAPATAAVLTGLICDGHAPINLSPFEPP
jgi:D-amino-acid dehydrogenase